MIMVFFRACLITSGEFHSSIRTMSCVTPTPLCWLYPLKVKRRTSEEWRHSGLEDAYQWVQSSSMLNWIILCMMGFFFDKNMIHFVTTWIGCIQNRTHTHRWKTMSWVVYTPKQHDTHPQLMTHFTFIPSLIQLLFILYLHSVHSRMISIHQKQLTSTPNNTKAKFPKWH